MIASHLKDSFADILGNKRGNGHDEPEVVIDILAPYIDHDENATRYYAYKGGPFHREDGPAIEYTNGDEVWYLDGKRHREGGPAVTKTIDGVVVKYYYQDDVLHRFDGPAIDSENRQEWYKTGLRHRVGGPAVIDKSSGKEWWSHGKRHRVGGPAVEGPSGNQWWVYGKQHRDDGPAVVSPEHREWIVNNKKHRKDGPAVEFLDGTKEWWWEGTPVRPFGTSGLKYKLFNRRYQINKAHINVRMRKKDAVQIRKTASSAPQASAN